MAILYGHRRSGKGYRAGEVVAAAQDDYSPTAAELAQYFIIHVSNATVTELNGYLEGWKHNATIQQLSHNTTTHERHIRVVSAGVSARGRNGIRYAKVLELIAPLNGTYIDHDQWSFEFSAVITPENQAQAQAKLSSDLDALAYAKRRWQVDRLGMKRLKEQGWSVSVKRAGLDAYLRDGLMDEGDEN